MTHAAARHDGDPAPKEEYAVYMVWIDSADDDGPCCINEVEIGWGGYATLESATGRARHAQRGVLPHERIWVTDGSRKSDPVVLELAGAPAEAVSWSSPEALASRRRYAR
jgi:hypothetical protein